MVAMRQIEAVGREIGREFHPERVILFGSHAAGTAGAGSDVDLLIIMPFEGKSVAKSVEVRLKIHPSFPVDILVRTPENVQERLDMGDGFMRNILQRGKVLYEATVLREMRARKNPNLDGACFHAQQCAEKYLKARLCQAGIQFEKVHDLVALLDQVVSVEPAWELFREDLAWLSGFAVAYRYPGESADKESAKDAKARCRKFRLAARKRFGLPAT